MEIYNNYRYEGAFNTRAYECVKTENEEFLRSLYHRLEMWLDRKKCPDGIKSEVMQIVSDNLRMFNKEQEALMWAIEGILIQKQSRFNNCRLNNLMQTMVEKRGYWEERVRAVGEEYLNDDPMGYNPLLEYCPPPKETINDEVTL